MKELDNGGDYVAYGPSAVERLIVRHAPNFLAKIVAKTQLFESSFRVSLISEGEFSEVEVPVYNLGRVGPSSCAAYVRLAARDIFGLNYEKGDAWNMSELNRPVARVNGDLDRLAADKVLRQGMVLGVEYPDSGYSNKEEYSHVMLYIGNSADSRELVFIENFNDITRTRTPSQFAEHNLKPVEIIASEDHPSFR